MFSNIFIGGNIVEKNVKDDNLYVKINLDNSDDNTSNYVIKISDNELKNKIEDINADKRILFVGKLLKENDGFVILARDLKVLNNDIEKEV